MREDLRYCFYNDQLQRQGESVRGSLTYDIFTTEQKREILFHTSILAWSNRCY